MDDILKNQLVIKLIFTDFEKSIYYCYNLIEYDDVLHAYHKLNGPAMVDIYGRKSWWVNNKLISFNWHGQVRVLDDRVIR